MENIPPLMETLTADRTSDQTIQSIIMITTIIDNGLVHIPSIMAFLNSRYGDES